MARPASGAWASWRSAGPSAWGVRPARRPLAARPWRIQVWQQGAARLPRHCSAELGAAAECSHVPQASPAPERQGQRARPSPVPLWRPEGASEPAAGSPSPQVAPRRVPGLLQSQTVMLVDEGWAPASESLEAPRVARFEVSLRGSPAPSVALLGVRLWAGGPLRAAPAWRPLRSRGHAASCPGPHPPMHRDRCPARRPTIPRPPPGWRRIPCADGSARDPPRTDGSRRR